MLSAKPLRLRRYENIHIITFIGLIILLWKISIESITWPHLHSFTSKADLSASNATLGFETIIVVAPNKSIGGETVWRQDGLQRAANIAGIQIQIPPQPNFTDFQILMSLTEERRNEIIERRKRKDSKGEFTDAEGRLRLGHLHVLKQILNSNYSTALILEDDADWDVALRDETPTIAHAIRRLTNGVIGPWGFNWDYLALGHCGAGAVPDDNFLVIDDNTTGPAKNFVALWNPEKPLMDNTRYVHGTHGTVCTFGYAVSRHGAKKLIDRLSKEGEPLDIDYADFCNGGGLSCYAVTPEIIHHQRWTGHRITSGGKDHGALEEGETAQKFTLNIKHSARCNSEPNIVKERAAGRQTSWIQCLPTGKAKGKYETR